MASITHFLTTELKLKVNETKSAVARPWDRKFLGFSFTANREPKRRIAPKALERFKTRVRMLTGRNKGVSLGQMIEPLARYLRGWEAYFGFCQTPSVLKDLNSWIRRRLRSFVWKQWRTDRRRFRELVARGVYRDRALKMVRSPHGPWRLSNTPAMSVALPFAFFDRLGLPSLQLHPNV
jgi:RNA-directed DNA polymerase